MMLEALAQVAALSLDATRAHCVRRHPHRGPDATGTWPRGRPRYRSTRALWVEPALPLWLVGAWATGEMSPT